jgi:arylsulfatase A-like enzyme
MSANDSKRPNVLMSTRYDLGQYLGCYGVPTAHSPNIDRLAGQGGGSLRSSAWPPGLLVGPR